MTNPYDLVREIERRSGIPTDIPHGSINWGPRFSRWLLKVVPLELDTIHYNPGQNVVPALVKVLNYYRERDND